MRRDRTVSLLVLAIVLAAGSCGGGGDSSKDSERLPDASSLIPTAAAPQPTPKPSPTPIPDDQIIVVVPGGGGGGSTSSADCGDPVPPPLARFNVKVHSHQADRYVLDSTPLVGPDAAYCARVGYPDRTICPVRLEGDAQRSACEAAVVGIAEDTGRAGPTWTANGAPCDGTDHGGASCVNHGSNQYLALAWGAGTFRACAASGLCGALSLP